MQKQKSPFIIFFIAVYFVMNVFGGLLFVLPVKAQVGGVVSDPGIYVRMAAQETKKTAWETIASAAMGAAMNSLSFMVRKVAFDTASYVAAGGKGQTPLAFDKGIKEYAKDVAGSAAGVAIESLGEPFGLNLCRIPDVNFNLNLKLGLANLYPKVGPDGVEQGPKANCSWQELRSNWSQAAFEEKYGEGAIEAAAEVFSGSLSIEQSGFGVAASSISQIDGIVARAGAATDLERLVNQGWKDVVSPISGKIVTPASQIRKEAESLSAAEQQKLNATQMAGVYGSELKNLPLMAASIFVNTLGQQLLKRIMKGLLPDNKEAGGAGGGIASFFASTLKDNRKAAERAFNFITAPTINQVDNYNIVADFVSDKVIDSGLEQAIDRGSKGGGEFLTIKEAIDQNLLHGDWQLIPPTNALNSSDDRNCYINAYCYSNIQKLRKARILPIGFELATLRSNPDRPWTLKEVVERFEDCDESGLPTDKQPYCHMINPDWIIKVPKTRCSTEGYGPNLVDNATPFRDEECMDLQTCISESANGTCLAWGYCTKEKNIWRIDGEDCPAEYSTCKTYTNTASGGNSSYLARTIDFGQCTLESVGCKGYSTERDLLNNEWETFSSIDDSGSLKYAGRPGTIYFNRNVKTCPSSSDGCTGFYGVTRNLNTGLFTTINGQYIKNTAAGATMYIKKAPDYLGCYDIDTSPSSLTDINWPQTESEVLNMNVPSECSKYAQVCAPTEAGCNFYRSDRTGASVPAIIKEQNGCPRECSGYETFKQRASNFEAEKFPLHFIPALGTICSAQYTGCDEFTNIEESGGGGERLEYYNYIRSCEKPDVVEEKTYFSWEGSHGEGYVLRNHRLKSIDASEAAYIAALVLDLDYNDDFTDDSNFNAGSPAYSDNTEVALQDNIDDCNKINYATSIVSALDPNAASSDCRQLYDNEGNEYYRIMIDTVSISDQCRRLRKSEPRLFVDTGITLSGICADQGKGVWDDKNTPGDPADDECKRCYGGGEIDENTCIYQALPDESSRCPSIANSCRAYVGNTGNNVRLNVISDGFENTTTTDGWALLSSPVVSDISISAESLQRGQHSLRISNSGGDTLLRIIEPGTNDEIESLQKNGWYELTFWARGAPQNLNIKFLQEDDPGVYQPFGLFTRQVLDPTVESEISIGNNWREFTLGPTQFTGDSLESVALSFKNSGSSAPYFLDNIRLSQIEDSAYIVKDSWKQEVTVDIDPSPAEDYQVRLADAPATCFDAGENPVGLLPGYALGCGKYTDDRNNTYFITEFSSLCREDAIGCEPLFDTNNTFSGDSRLPRIYNLVCKFDDNSTSRECSINFFEAIGNCFIPQGETQCYIPELILPVNEGDPDNTNDDYYRGLYPDGVKPDDEFLFGHSFLPNIVSMDLSTVYIPPESGTPIFLTNRTEYHCPEGDIGCTYMGLQDHIMPSTTTLSYDYLDIYIKNNPEEYSKTLCREELLGCGEFTAGANTYYFKDPVETGNSVCSYKENIAGLDGWYVNGVGKCHSNTSLYCKDNNDCSSGDCVDIGLVPCYEDYLRDEVYGIWSNDSPAYKNFSGACANTYDSCTELLDPADTSSINPEGTSYYRIFDNKLTGRTGECNGQVNLKDGCVLLDKTDQPNKFYSTKLTYEASGETEPRYESVNPKTATAADAPAINDTNLLLKVTRDRDCSEWLTCSDKSIVRDEKGNKQVLCSKYKACEKLKPNSKEDECLNFVRPTYGDTFLDANKYLERDLSWYGEDYSGYSLLNRHQISTFGYFTFPTLQTKQFLGAQLPSVEGIVNVCTSSTESTNGNKCGPDSMGRCFGGRCLNKIDNTDFPGLDIDTSTATPEEIDAAKISAVRRGLTSANCKLYPEEDSPFPYINIAEGIDNNDDTFSSKSRKKTNKDSAGNLLPDLENKSRIEFTIANEFFKKANLCQSEEDCSCDYKKYIYPNFTDYYAVPTTADTYDEAAPEGICLGGDKDGEPCKNDNHCIVKDDEDNVISAGQCNKLKEIQTRLGVKGFCLEYDLSRPINGRAKRESDQQYACQTWLPIQTSASNIDLFHMNVSAGYNPDLDAVRGEVGGELFCSATHEGRVIDRSFDSGMTFVDRIQGEYDGDNFNQSYVDRMFDRITRRTDCQLAGWPDDEILISDLRTASIGGVVQAFGIEYLDESPYGKIICEGADDDAGSAYTDVGFYVSPSLSPDNNAKASDGGGINMPETKDIIEKWKPFIYRMLTSFAWNRIGNNAVLLRAEYHPNKDLASGHKQRFAPWVGARMSVGTTNYDSWEETEGAFDRYTHNVNVLPGGDPTAYGGLYNFENADNFINEFSVKDMYFIPLVLKGMVRGVVPKTINDLANPTIETEQDEWQNEVLRLPIKELKKENSSFNGLIEPLRGVVIQKNNDYMQYRIINLPVTEDVNGYSKDSKPHKYFDDVKTDGSNFANNQLLTWRYKVDRTPDSELFWEDGVQTKYVIAFFANDTGVIDYVDDGTTDGYDTDAPSFIIDHLRSFGGFPEQFVPEKPENDPFNSSVGCQRGYVNGERTGGVEEELPHYNPWWAVAVNFGVDGEFLGYTTRWCRGYTTQPGDENNENAQIGAGIGFAVIADLNNQCEEIVQVHDGGNVASAETLNKAWTNRVWSEAQNADETALNHPYLDYGKFNNLETPMINRTFARRPFGSLMLSADLLNDLTNKELLNFSFKDRKLDGIPYSCAGYFMATDAVGLIMPSVRASLDNDDDRLNFCSFSKESNYRDNIGDYNGSEIMQALQYNGYMEARDAIFSLFVKQFIRVKLDGNLATPRLKYVNTGVADSLLDESATTYGRIEIERPIRGWVIDPAPAKWVESSVVDYIEYLAPPMVFSLNPVTCSDDVNIRGSADCTAAEFNNISVGGNTGEIRDYNGDGQLDTFEYEKSFDIVAVDSYTANVKFFAYADDNRMPIRRVSVNWGDGFIKNESTKGYYKNSKPFCATESNGNEVIPLCKMKIETRQIPSGLTCETDADCPASFNVNTSGGFLPIGDEAPDAMMTTPDCMSVPTLEALGSTDLQTYAVPRFGNAPRACSTEPFEFEHPYTCDSSSIYDIPFSNLPTDQRDLVASEIEKYNSTVDVVDIITLTSGTRVCKYQPKVQVVDNWGYCNGSCPGGLGGDYCYETSVSGTNECKWDFPGSPLIIDRPYAWASFKGTIIVVSSE